MSRGSLRSSRKPVFTTRGRGRARDSVSRDIIQVPDLGACAGCDGYGHQHSHEIVEGRVAIHCGVVQGTVFPRTDISSHTKCSPEDVIKVT